jgi:signal transduction histidine kinase
VLTDSFNHMADALQQRIERDARFASDVSRELRSPLTTLATAVEVLNDSRDMLPGQARGAVELLRAEVHRFQRMVLDLLEISRLDAGVAELILQEMRLGELVRRAVEGALSAERGDSPTTAAARPAMEIAVDDQAADLVVMVDKRRLERVVANLVDNAQTHGGGLAAVSVTRAGDRVRVAVDDHGPGVPAAYRERIFERFSRVPATAGSRRDGSGVGLGLALVGEHVRLHRGRVWVEDRRGGGARFVVDLPTEPR